MKNYNCEVVPGPPPRPSPGGRLEIGGGRIALFAAIALVLVACQPCPACPQCPACPTCGQQEADNTPPAEAPRAYNEWFVVHVTDGDTLVVKQQLGEVLRKDKIRMLNINTPERGKPLYKEATEALKELVRGGDVTLEYPKPGEESRGGYGRILAYVHAEGKNVNLEMVRQGWSKYYTKYGKSKKYDKEFTDAEAHAKEKRLGLWSLPQQLDLFRK